MWCLSMGDYLVQVEPHGDWFLEVAQHQLVFTGHTYLQGI